MRKKTTETTPKKETKTKPKKTSVQDVLANLRLEIKHKNETQKKLTNSIKNNDVTICSGPAGTGKTFLAVYESLMLLKTHPDIYKEIKLVKSITQLKNEEIGSLPGDANDKLRFHMMSYMDAFYQIIGEEKTNLLIELNVIKFDVFGTIRGRSFNNAIIIVDEFQNITHDNAKTFLTRFSDNTKVIVLGDFSQIDLKVKSDSSFERLLNKVKSKQTQGVEVIEFVKKDIVRHRLTNYFIELFEESEPLQQKPIKPIKEQQKVKKTGFFGFIRNIFR